MKLSLKVALLLTILCTTMLLSLPIKPSAVWSQEGADDDSCIALVENALQTIGSACAEIGRNAVCYGNLNVEAQFHNDIQAQFDTVGDIVDVADLNSLLTRAADLDAETWGIALLNLQADLPDDSDDNLSLIIFGDAEITSTVSDASESKFTAPMQAITLRSGTSNTCEQAPDGLLIRSPEGQRTRLMVNGVELTLSSATFITAEADAEMGIQGLEGNIDVTAQGQTETITPGFITTIGLDANLEPISPPSPPVPVQPNVEFPFDILTAIFPDATETDGASSGSTGGTSLSLTNTFSSAALSFSYPDEWFVLDFPEEGSAIVITNAEDPSFGLDNLPPNTLLTLVSPFGVFAAAFSDTLTGSTPDALIRSMAQQPLVIVLSGPEIIELGPHTVTRLQLGSADGSFNLIFYGFADLIMAEYVSSDSLADFDATLQAIIASISFDS